MNYMKLVVMAGVFAVATALGAAPPTEEKRVADDKHGGMAMDCAKECNACQRECDLCTRHCAEMLASGKKEHLATLGACEDCASVCAVAAQIVSRQGPMSGTICDACAKACTSCGAACEKFPDDELMKRCAQECRKCEKACRDMLKHADFGAAGDSK
jgi:hypothetical protein